MTTTQFLRELTDTVRRTLIYTPDIDAAMTACLEEMPRNLSQPTFVALLDAHGGEQEVRRIIRQRLTNN